MLEDLMLKFVFYYGIKQALKLINKYLNFTKRTISQDLFNCVQILIHSPKPTKVSDLFVEQLFVAR